MDGRTHVVPWGAGIPSFSHRDDGTTRIVCNGPLPLSWIAMLLYEAPGDIMKAISAMQAIPPSVGLGACDGSRTLREVDLGESSIDIIEVQAFYGCAALSSVVLPKRLKTIESAAFEKCVSLSSITLPDTLVELGVMVFAYCTSLVSIKIPSGVTHLCSGMFIGCTSLREVSLPETLLTVGSTVFCHCTSLRDVELPQSVNAVYDDHFVRCLRGVCYTPNPPGHKCHIFSE